MNTYGARPEVIAIPVDEYKELLAANTELKIIYHKLESCAITTEKYTFHEFVQNCMMRCIRWNWTLKLLPLSFRAWLNLWRRCTRREQRG